MEVGVVVDEGGFLVVVEVVLWDGDLVGVVDDVDLVVLWSISKLGLGKGNRKIIYVFIWFFGDIVCKFVVVYLYFCWVFYCDVVVI